MYLRSTTQNDEYEQLGKTKEKKKTCQNNSKNRINNNTMIIALSKNIYINQANGNNNHS